MTWLVETHHQTLAADGSHVEVIQEVNAIGFQSPSGRLSMSHKGRRRFRLADGKPVHKVDDSTFQVVETDEVLTKI